MKLSKIIKTPEVLWSSQWFKVLLVDGWYTCIKGSDGVCVLGFRKNKDKTEYLVRMEHTPCHGEGLIRTSLTGTIEKGSSPLETAVKELKEESGYSAKPDEMVDLGWFFSSKNSFNKVYLFGVDLSGKEAGEILGDGSKGEDGAYCIWLDENDTLSVPQASFGMAISKLRNLGLI